MIDLFRGIPRTVLLDILLLFLGCLLIFPKVTRFNQLSGPLLVTT